MSNVQYPTQTFALFEPTGPVVGFRKGSSSNESWNLIGGPGLNDVAFQNRATGTFASVDFESQRGSVVGGREPYTWRVIYRPVDGPRFQIVTEDGKYVWRLTGGDNGDLIVLQQTPYLEKDAEWVIEENIQRVQQ